MPVSGTKVRADPHAAWDFIEPPVRGWFARRICLLGAESTGTTTLARALAERLQTSWVEEYGREYSARKKPGEAWHTEEFELIATEQARREDAAAERSNRILLCDTNAFATVLWHRRYVGGPCPAVGEIARRSRCDLYLLTGDEIAFEQDGLRDGEHIRHEMHGWFEAALSQQAVPWKLVRGSREERLQQAVGHIAALFANSTWKPV
jgi:NadR type nicotinamide-nucleotide adenylyltransferase